MKNKYDTVIFDLGFTLFTFENFTLKRYFNTLNKGLDRLAQFLVEKTIIDESNIRVFKKVFKKHRIRNFQRSLTKYIESTTIDNLSQTFDSLKLPKIDPEIAHKASLLYHSTEGTYWKLRSSTKPMLKELRANNFKIGLLSNAPYHPGIVFLMDTNGLTQYFDVITSSAQIGFCKPDKRAFEYVLKEIQSSPKRTVMIGDDLKNDIFGAQQLGIKAIHVKKSFQITPNRDVGVTPDGAVADLNEIISIIHEWNNS